MSKIIILTSSAPGTSDEETMKLENVKSLTVMLVPKSAVSEFQSELSRREGTPYIRIHPAVLKGIKFDTERLRCIDNAEIFGVYCDLNRIDEILKAKAEVVGAWKVEPTQLKHELSSTVRSGLMDSSLELTMRFKPVAPGSGSNFSIERGEEMPGGLRIVLEEALSENLALGIDGCIPIVDANLKVTIVKWTSTDPFLFRQEAAVHRSVRDGFIKALGND